MFGNRGLCYAVLPNHVSASRDRIALAVPAPAETGVAEIFWRDPDQDLALAYVEGSLSQRCQLELRDLTANLSGLLQTQETGTIKSVHFQGMFFDRLGAAVIDVDDQFVTVRITDQGVDAEVMQGLSGALLTLAGRPVGIAIDAGSTGEARFLRLDHATLSLGANLGTDHPNQRAITPAETGQGFRVTGFGGGDAADVVALEPGSVTAPWVADWTGQPIVFEITLSNDALVPVNRIIMRSRIEETSTAPRRIRLEVDRGLPGNAYWTQVIAPDMAPDGVFEAVTGGTVARRLRVHILDVWHATRPLRLDQLTLE